MAESAHFPHYVLIYNSLDDSAEWVIASLASRMLTLFEHLQEISELDPAYSVIEKLAGDKPKRVNDHAR